MQRFYAQCSRQCSSSLQEDISIDRLYVEGTVLKLVRQEGGSVGRKEGKKGRRKDNRKDGWMKGGKKGKKDGRKEGNKEEN